MMRRHHLAPAVAHAATSTSLHRAGMVSNCRAGAGEVSAWSLRVGFEPLVLTAFERSDRDGVVFVRWSDPQKSGRDRRSKRSVGLRVRNTDGILDVGLIAAAELAVRAFYTALIAGEDPSAPDAHTLTIPQGYALALDLKGGGLYAADTQQRRHVTSAGRTVAQLLGRDMCWSALRNADVVGLWRVLATRYRDGGVGGPRQAEVTVSSLYTIAQWLRDNEYIEPNACCPRSKWRRLFQADWETITGTPVAPRRPRHSPDDLHAVFAALHAADPRMHLAIELGAELRVGQVLRLQRSAVMLEAGAHSPHGRVQIAGAVRKAGEMVHLTAAQRSALDASLGGYLQAHERAYLTGELADYPMFPGGRLVRGVARVRERPKRLNRRTALELFHNLERAAGVVPQSGRGWYGLRRQATDLAPKYTNDDRVLDRVGGHERATREGIYQDRQTDQLRGSAAEVRAQIRSGIDESAAR